jgi:AcrR family transcriptional regulator
MPLSKLLPALKAEPHPKRERRKDARPGELLEAALDLFVEKGFAATRAEEVAARAGVSKGTLFLYFQSKEDLFKAVVQENLSVRFVEWNAEYETFKGSTSDMLRYCLKVWWERVGSTKTSGITKLIMSEAHNFPEVAAFYQAEVIRPASTLIRRILQRGIDSGEFRAMDLEYAQYSVTSVIIFLVMWKHSMGSCVPDSSNLDPERYIASQVDLLLNGLLARAP